MVINEVEDAFCTPPDSIITQNGKDLYYFKMGQKSEDDTSEDGHHNIETHLMKYDLEHEIEEQVPNHTYTLHGTEIDTPLYIQFANDGYEFDGQNKSFYEN